MTLFIILWLLWCVALGLVGNESEGKFFPAFLGCMLLTPLIGGVLTLIMKRVKGNESNLTRYRPFFVFGYAIITLLAFTMPFYYVPDYPTILTKDTWGFKNTLVQKSDVDELIAKYNNASLYERIEMRKESLLKTLQEEKLVQVDETDQK